MSVAVEDQHNKYRSAVARGTVRTGNNQMCRNATQMWKLKYDCALEKSAYSAAKDCSESDSRTANVDEFMVWERHKGIGCAVVRCASATKVVCHYSPAVVRLGNTIYAMGPTCNRCKLFQTTCSKGLCVQQ
ncbi:hypothetical protein Aduo_003001 [Ancylostoma duodenale]